MSALDAGVFANITAETALVIAVTSGTKGAVVAGAVVAGTESCGPESV